MITGFVETARSFQVRGWVAGAADAAGRIQVELLIDGRPIASANADLFREDLLKAGIGDGRHAYVLNADVRLPLDRTDLIAVRATTALGQSAILPFAPSFRALPEIVDSAIKGCVGVLLPSEIRGWAWDSARPDDHLLIDVRVNGRSVGLVKADELRPDLTLAKIGQGDHAFSFLPVERLPTDTPGAIQVYGVTTSGDRHPLQNRFAPLVPLAPQTAALQTVVTTEPRLAFLGQINDRSQRPVFILGARRSGTSAIAQALQHNTRYAGCGEGHVLDLAEQLVGTVDRFYRERAQEWNGTRSTLMSITPAAFFHEAIRHAFVELARRQFPAGYWFDKTPRPEMTLSAPLLREIWPEARFLFLKRRPADNIASRQRKFPAESFEAHCTNWALSMEAWLSVRDRLRDASLEIDQAELARDPDKVALELVPLLSLHTHEAERVAQALRVDWPERTSANFGSTLGADSIGWTANQIATLEKLCRPMADVFWPPGSAVVA